MPPAHRNGRLEIRLNDDGCQAIANIYPPSGKDGQAVEYADVIDKLKTLGIMYGYRDQAIRDALRQAAVKSEIAYNIVVAQGVAPQPGQDAKVRYHLPMERLTAPVPRRGDGSGVVDWFALDENNLTRAGEELATIVPPQPGVPGRTLVAPVQTITPRAGKGASLSAGQNIRYSDDGLRLFAAQDGYVCLHGEQLIVHAFRRVLETAASERLDFPAGAVFFKDVFNAEVQAGGFIAIQGRAVGAYLRARSDLLIHSAEDCRIVATGNVYVAESLRNCDVIASGKIFLLGAALAVGGTLRGRAGVEAGSLGSDEMLEMRVETGQDAYSAHRLAEIQEEIAAAEANIVRISQTLKPFITIAAQSTMSEEKRALLSKLQAQQRSQELGIKELHSERRQVTIASKERIQASVTARDTAHPGVWLRIGNAEMLIESPLSGARFFEAAGGRAVTVEPLQRAA